MKEKDVSLISNIAGSISKSAGWFFIEELDKLVKDNKENLDNCLCINLHVMSISMLCASLLTNLFCVTDAPKEILLKDFYGKLERYLNHEKIKKFQEENKYE